MRLDNAALIFPAIRRTDWSNVFRVSATMTENVDPEILQKAAENLKPRFPSMYVRLKTGLFWYYLEKARSAPAVQEELASPLCHMTRAELRESCLRILYYRNRISVEFFHSATDGSGGIIYLKNLTAEYLRLRYGLTIPCTSDILDLSDEPKECELEDSFSKAAGKVALSRKESGAVHIRGKKEADRFVHITQASVDESKLLELAHSYNCTVTAFLCSVMIDSIIEMGTTSKIRKWIKVTVPVNLRKIFGGCTLRNFTLAVNVGIDPRLGIYTLEDLCSTVSSQLKVLVTPQQMAAMAAANVKAAENFAVRLMPLSVKNMAMRVVYRSVGESRGTINISNLGKIKLPDEMSSYIKHMDFVIGPQITYHNNCSLASCNGCTRISLIRSSRDSALERAFLTKLVSLGLDVTVESNAQREVP